MSSHIVYGCTDRSIKGDVQTVMVMIISAKGFRLTDHAWSVDIFDSFIFHYASKFYVRFLSFQLKIFVFVHFLWFDLRDGSSSPLSPLPCGWLIF